MIVVNTKQIEIIFEKSLHASGMKYWTEYDEIWRKGGALHIIPNYHTQRQ